MKKIRLPKDGADYHCTYVSDGQYDKCGVVTSTGITSSDWERLMAEGYKGMRAVCNEHFTLLENGIVK